MTVTRKAKIRKKTGKAGTRWYVTVQQADGREVGHGGGFRTRREAQALANEIVVDASRGKYVAPAGTTLAQYLLDEWLPSRENADLSVGTRAVGRTIVEALIVPHIGTIPLQQLTARDIDCLYRTLRTEGSRSGRGLSGKSIRNAHMTLTKSLGDAVRRGHLLVNPMSAIDPPPIDDSVERKAWSREEALTFLSATNADRLSAIWRLLLATGVRRGELLGITWDDVDLKGGAVTIARQVLVLPRSSSDARRVYVRETTKTQRRRRVRIDDSVAATLRRWKALQAEEHMKFGPAWHADGGVGVDAPSMVTEPDGMVVHPDTLSSRWVVAVKAAGVTPITIHGARHTYAEIALSAGVQLDVVSRQLGHASIGTTGDIYLHDEDASATEAARIVGRAIEGDVSR